MNKRSRWILLLVFLLVVIVGVYLIDFYTDPRQPEYDILQDEPCALPCWANITPGKSTQYDTLTALTEGQLKGSSPGSVRENRVQFVTQAKDIITFRFSEENGKVQQIDFLPSAELILSDFVEKFGSPEKIDLRVDGEHEICMVGYLYYPQHGLLITSGECVDFNRTDAFKNGNILPDTPVISLSFVEFSTNAEQMLQSLQRVQGIKLEEVPLNWVDWAGYGHYEPSE